jgi:hypothetical protein
MAELLCYVTQRSGGLAYVEVHPEGGDDFTRVVVDDMEPDDVITPILQRAIEEAGVDEYIVNVTKVTTIDDRPYLVTTEGSTA